ncbi:hypothetical protein [Atlantibacter hermannii]|uniref:hypothetical protein n=1 Tax=Atlantibacter hermannii TaxID=565 RepID=UPI0028AF661B|nr:hypothetical protein [Atlantibacter hermannii]
MSNVIFSTIVTGVSVFVLGQILVKCILDPYISFKEQLGMLSAILLREQHKIVNINANSEVITEIRLSSALLLSKANAVPMYSFFAKFRLLPPYKNVIKASGNLNLIAYYLEERRSAISPGNRDAYVAVQNSLSSIGNELGVIVCYKS